MHEDGRDEHVTGVERGGEDGCVKADGVEAAWRVCVGGEVPEDDVPIARGGEDEAGITGPANKVNICILH